MYPARQSWLPGLEAILLAFALGCGSGAAAPAPPSAGLTATLEPAGTDVAVPLEGGGTLLVKVPPGAVTSPVAVTFTPVSPPAGAWAAVRIVPAGTHLAVPATVRVTLPSGLSPTADGALVLLEGGHPFYLRTEIDRATRTLEGTVSVLGFGEGAGAASAVAGAGAVGDPAVDLVAASASLQTRLDDAQRYIDDMNTFGLLVSGERANAAMLAVFQLEPPTQDPVRALTVAWREALCNQAVGAETVFRLFVYTTVADFEAAARPMLDWFAVYLDAQATLGPENAEFLGCPTGNPDPAARIGEKSGQFLSIAQGELDRIDASTVIGFDAVVAKIRQIVRVAGSLAEVGALTGFLQAATSLAADAVDRLRDAAYLRCREDGSLHLHRRLNDFIIAGGGDSLARFTEFDVAGDAQLCSVSLALQVVESGSGAVIGSGALGGGADLGSVKRAEHLALGTTSRLEIGGSARALLCPVSQTFNTESLGIRAAGSTILTVGHGSDGSYLVEPLAVGVDQLRALAGLPQDGAGLILLDFTRMGGSCGMELFVESVDFRLGTLEVELPATPNVFAGDYFGSGFGEGTLPGGERFAESSVFTVSITPAGTIQASGTVGRTTVVPFTATGQVDPSGASQQSGAAGAGQAACPFTFAGTFVMDGPIKRGEGTYESRCPDGSVSAGTWSCTTQPPNPD
jgi:hypothetical protein